nr:MAG TPA: hypothetical protein [Caudoviricetes sp.]
MPCDISVEVQAVKPWQVVPGAISNKSGAPTHGNCTNFQKSSLN